MSLDTVCSFARHDGQPISGLDHYAQSVVDILTTPIGSRVMNRSYGARCISRLDAPMNAALKAELTADVAEALAAHDPRGKLRRVTVDFAAAGEIQLTIETEYLGAAQAIPVRLGGARD